MSDHTIIRLWTGLALAASATTGSTQTIGLQQASPLPAPNVILAQADGEAGEAGMVEDQTPEMAYALRLALVDVHLHAAVEVYRAGMPIEAYGLAAHPEAEVMEELRADLASRGIADFSSDLDALMEAVAAERPIAEIEAAYRTVADAITAAYGNTPAKARLDAAYLFARQAALEYAEITAGGTVSAPDTYIETYSMIIIARGLLQPLLTGADPVAAEAAAQGILELEVADQAYSVPDTPPEARDPEILFGVAARVQLAGYRVK